MKLRRARDLLLLLLLCLGLRVVGLVRPCLSDDEATYCVVGREMLSGHVLYRDVVDHKPPLIYLTYAATQALGGPVGGMRLLHLLTALVVFATALLLGAVARLLSPGRPDAGAPGPAGLVRRLLYVVFSTTLLDFDALAANCELFMMLPLAASVVRLPPGRAGWLSRRRPRGAGALVGVAMLYKYQAAVQLPLYAVHLAVVRRPAPGSGARRMGRARGRLARGGRRLRRRHARGGRPGRRPGSGFASTSPTSRRACGCRSWRPAPPSASPTACSPRCSSGCSAWGPRSARFAAPARRRIRSGSIASRPAGCSRARSPSRRADGSSGTTFTRSPRRWRCWPRRRPAVSGRRARGLVLGAVGVPAAAFFLAGVLHRRLMAAAGAPDPDYPALSAFVAAHSRPGDRLAVWGNAPVLYFEAERPLGSRFVFSNYLTGLSPATRTQTDPRADASANVVAESWDMFEADLVARRPRLFVDTSPGNIAAYGKFPPARYPRLQAILDRDYRPIGEVAGARILALRAP